MTFIKKIKILTFLFSLSINFNHYSHAHMRGTFSLEKEAVKKSLELGCVGTHQNQGKWLPCKDEKELHKHLRK